MTRTYDGDHGREEDEVVGNNNAPDAPAIESYHHDDPLNAALHNSSMVKTQRCDPNDDNCHHHPCRRPNENPNLRLQDPSDRQQAEPETHVDRPTAAKLPSHNTHPNKPYTIVALYRFQTLSDPHQVRNELDVFLRQHHVLGTILLAIEGINGTICYPTPLTTKAEGNGTTTADTDRIDIRQQNRHPNGGAGTDPVLHYLKHQFGDEMRIRISYSEQPVFFRLKVRCKDEIVTLGVPELIPLSLEPKGTSDGDIPSSPRNVPSSDATNDNHAAGRTTTGSTTTHVVGEYVKPRDWNALIQDPNTWVIDTRNKYEIQVGTFRNASNPQTTTFTEFPSWFQHELEHRRTKQESSHPHRIAMFCTGGIRCEKATAYCQNVLKQSNSDVDNKIPVYHLQGGILAYLDEIPSEQSLFDGECYVFDQRVAVTHGLHPTTQWEACHACRHPLTKQDRHDTKYVHGITCPYCVDDPDKQIRRQRYEARQSQLQVAHQLGIVHLGSTLSTSRTCENHVESTTR